MTKENITCHRDRNSAICEAEDKKILGLLETTKKFHTKSDISEKSGVKTECVERFIADNRKDILHLFDDEAEGDETMRYGIKTFKNSVLTSIILYLQILSRKKINHLS